MALYQVSFVGTKLVKALLIEPPLRILMDSLLPNCNRRAKRVANRAAITADERSTDCGAA